MTSAVSRAVVEAFYRAYASRDTERIAPFLDDEVEWVISGPVDLLPFCGSRYGKAAVLDMVERQIPELFQVYGFSPDLLLVDGDRASTLVRLAARHNADGRIISYRVANFLHFRADKVVENLSLIDSFDAVEQVLGHPLPVHEAQPDGLGDLVAV